MFGVSNVKLVQNCYMENIWARMGHHIAKNVIRITLESSVPIVLGSFLEKFYKLVTIIIFIRLVLGVQNVEILLAMAKKCFFKVLPSGIQDADQVRTNL
jgi:hypothetical protein